MFASVLVSEPLERVADDWDYLHEKVVKRFSTFREAGANVYGIRQRHIDPDGMADRRKGRLPGFYELGPDGVVSCEYQPLTVHVTLSGTPHHVPHNFGYWHVNDMDELYLPIPDPPGSDTGFFVICMGNPRPGDTDGFAWYCERCTTLLFQRDFATGDQGIDTFWRSERAAVTEYNSDAANRRCPECRHENPLGYCWGVSKDTAAEAEARSQW